ncbi:transcriptional regulator NanR [Pseudohalocynthiibacter aestuariivivens]|jgi:GntR family transcriptional regulator, sialic acid-inducible nan operon repressor|uniref:Transcriptional regulator NanR n=1 Tax=Pseudohalocynthiibacter aestuariivivens TaxID=1591409 RepID=A0ABV5JE21_9RHOB|nr:MULTISPECIES: transcriptional regulator NanR [Pseudohalocynthiibacter]MBS9718093.1 transcriptional regulator NanR [Pseudohalocynthiibacter aestuariivivens]MCK0103304.1 transcriptional regulator NanR [Pseudohalocynthiibacter sp. F2068]
MPADPNTKPERIDTPIVRQKLSDQVFERLWDMVQSGELAPGDAMPSERALMERFNVGRPAVREALQSMANKGLISITHGERSRVNKLTAGIAFDQMDDIAKLLLSTEPSNLEHLKQLRKILEAGTTQLAAERCTPDDISVLRALIEDQRSKLGQDKAFIEADIAFHVAIAKISGNPLIQAVTQAMLSWLFEYYKPLLLWTGRENTTLLEHDRMVDFLETHDVSGAMKMMGDHLSRSDPLYKVT